MTTDRAEVPTARDHRQRQIAEVLARYGLIYLGNVVGLERMVTAALRRVAPASADGRSGRPIPPRCMTEPMWW
jgi:hypothetical protein